MRLFLSILFQCCVYISIAQNAVNEINTEDIKFFSTQEKANKEIIVEYQLFDRILSTKDTFFIKNLYFNSDDEDFGTSFYKDKIVFASSGNRADLIKRKWDRNDMPFLDLVIADVNEENEFMNIKAFRKTINKKFHEGPATFNKEGDYMILTGNNYSGAVKGGAIQLKLYSSGKKDGKWQSPKSLLFNSDDYSTGHASLTADGTTMYLASDMPGGFGGVDLYVSRKENDSVWSEPLNLGNKINTEGNEMFPFIHPSGILFYSSDGLTGKGGLDIFMSKPGKEGFSEPAHLDDPVNSLSDDFAFIMNDEMTGGYFSSDRPGGKGNSDIYSFSFKKSLNLTLSGYAYDNDYNTLKNVFITLNDNSDNIYGEICTDSTGYYRFDLDVNKNYTISGICKGFSEATNSFSTIKKTGEIFANLFFVHKPSISFICYVKDHETYEAVEGVTVYFTENEKTEKYLSTETGQIKKLIKNEGLHDTLDFQIRFEKEGFLTKSIKYQNVITNEKDHKMHVILDMVREGMDLAKIINLNPIYFDLNKSDIRPDAAAELDKIVKIMNDNPSIVIELGSHTDSRGEDRSNLKLSESRAKSSAKYIQERIDDPKRIYGKGFGESKLINHCEDDIPCTEEEHQLNRRTEFKIIKK